MCASFVLWTRAIVKRQQHYRILRWAMTYTVIKFQLAKIYLGVLEKSGVDTKGHQA